MQSTDLIETYAYGTSEDLVSGKAEMKRNNIIKGYKNYKLWWFYKRKHKRT